jgi:hypothetical protein
MWERDYSNSYYSYPYFLLLSAPKKILGRITKSLQCKRSLRLPEKSGQASKGRAFWLANATIAEYLLST